MTDPIQKPSDTYSPLYFLASLGAGGMSVTFFMYLLFWVPHKGRAVPVFGDIKSAFLTGDLPLQIAIAVAVAGIAIFTILNLKSMIWNLNALAKFKKTDAYETLRNSNAETTLLAQPLAMAMTVNALFIVGLVFVPGLWSIVEYLFPLAMLAFALIGIMALRIIGDFLGRVLTKGGIFDVTAHNSFAQLLPAFALAMVAVGFSAPAAMSANPTMVGISLILSTFFGIASLLYTVVAAITAFSSMLHYGTAKEAGPTLMVIVPIMTTLGIMFLRQDHGLHVMYGVDTTPGETLVFLARLLTVQVVFLMLGLVVLRRQGYFTDFIKGTKTSPGSYALVCPGVALSVMVQFFLHKGLVAAFVIDKFSPAYWAVVAVAIGLQIVTTALIIRLNRRHFGKPAPMVAVPAE